MEQLIITVTDAGVTTIEAKGFKGKGCAKATEPIEKALGRITGDQKKPEYMQVATQVAAAKAGN